MHTTVTDSAITTDTRQAAQLAEGDTCVILVYTGRRMWQTATGPTLKYCRVIIDSTSRANMERDVLGELPDGEPAGWNKIGRTFGGGVTSPPVGSVWLTHHADHGKSVYTSGPKAPVYLGKFDVPDIARLHIPVEYANIDKRVYSLSHADRRAMCLSWCMTDTAAANAKRNADADRRSMNEPDALEETVRPLRAAYYAAPPSQRPFILARVIYLMQKTG